MLSPRPQIPSRSPSGSSSTPSPRQTVWILGGALATMVVFIVGVHRLSTFPSSLREAVIRNDRSAVWLLIQMGGPVAEIDRLGRTPLFEARSAGMVQLLVSQGADVNARTPIGATPLLMAIRHNRVEVVRQLLDRGADVEARFGAGGLPIHFAAHMGNPEIIQLLVQHRSPLRERDGYGFTPLVIAQRLGHEEATQILLQALGRPS